MFTQENSPLLVEASFMNFQFMKDGKINYHKHGPYERGLFFIKQAIEKHGNKYGYTKVRYIDTNTKVTITCEHHGDFEQTPVKHLNGQACPKCAKNALQTTETFIKRAKKVHGNKYDYSDTQYTGALNNLDILCPIHGRYSVSASNHLSGSGCAQCYYDSLKMSLEEFLIKAKKVHGSKYDYSSVQYKSSQKKIEIGCPEHGSFFSTPNNHLRFKGCPKCAGTYSPTTEEFIEKARTIHGDKYDYSLVQYKNNKEKIEIFCPVPGHGTFFQAPTDHLSFKGCPRCAGKNHNILYLLKCNETGWYKIGITTDDIQKRLTSIGGHIEEIHNVKLADPRKHESILHKKYENAREFNLFVRNGNTEFFSLTESQAQEIIKYMNEVSSNA